MLEVEAKEVTHQLAVERQLSNNLHDQDSSSTKYMYVCSYVCIMYVCMYVCMYIRMYVHTYVCEYVCMYVSVCMCTYMTVLDHCFVALQ